MRLSYRTAENTLRLTLDVEQREVCRVEEIDGTLDIGEQGRLIGVEFRAADGQDLSALLSDWLRDAVAGRYIEIDGDTTYLALSAPEEDIPEDHVRSAPVILRSEIDRAGRLVALGIPRRGHGYEISFPSGNR